MTIAIKSFIDQMWDQSIIPTLKEYIKIPNKSPAFDPNWQQHGYMQQAIELFANWCKTQNIPEKQVEIIQLENRTPVLLVEIPGQSAETILLYGHLDKQPEMTGWASDLNPWQPVIKNNRLYGRGSADDGYALFSALTAILALQKQNISHARCIILIEACEESGSYDLPFYMEKLATRIGQPSLIIGLDSGCGNYDQLWNTTSLRGVINGDLSIKIMTEGVHSGNASGIVPCTTRILRQLLSRLEDQTTGEILIPELHTTIPAERIAQVKKSAEILGEQTYSEFPLVTGAKPISFDSEQLILNRSWKPTLSVVGAEGFPALEFAGNVLRPETIVRLSFRTPPNCDIQRASNAIKTILEKDPPYGAQIEFKLGHFGPGWDAPKMQTWLIAASEQASEIYFGKPCAYMGEGGSIPFMGMLGEQFPKAQFVITGVLGPHSNAHGPNEFLHIDYAKKITGCIASIIEQHFLVGE
jgi:acetylornithine deacetylase/succinyl-diaminopimelate desuccinylase-like protein